MAETKRESKFNILWLPRSQTDWIDLSADEKSPPNIYNT